MTGLLRRIRAAWYGLVTDETNASRRYWAKRALRHGERAVLNLGHKAAGDVTKRQLETLLPMLRGQLRGDERLILDYGCGPGRFTAALADAVGGRSVGVDPTDELIHLAPAAANVEYHVLRDATLPLADATVDVAWLCLVLCCIVDDSELQRATQEIRRVLKPGGLVFLVENTSERRDLPHIRFRAEEDYVRLFPWASLRRVGEYVDLGERISVLAGRAK